jgi:hypothetical protein
VEDLAVFVNITTSTKWRVLMTAGRVAGGGWRKDVRKLGFYSTYTSPTACSGPITPGTAIDSGNAGAGWGPANAFDAFNTTMWGGRPNSDGVFYLGSDWGTTSVSVRCVTMTQEAYDLADQFMVQAWDDVMQVWRTVRVVDATTSVLGDNYIPAWTDIPSPSPTPTISTTTSLTSSSSRTPSASPSPSATSSPIRISLPPVGLEVVSPPCGSTHDAARSPELSLYSIFHVQVSLPRLTQYWAAFTAAEAKRPTRPTLRWLVVPTWWSNANTSSPATAIDVASQMTELSGTAAVYANMVRGVW